MASPQDGIFVEGGRFHWALEYTRPPASEPRAVVEAARRALWEGLAADRVSAGLCPFESMGEPGKAVAPATQLDLLLWIHGPAIDAVFDTALTVHWVMATAADLDLDVPGFVYRDSRDLTGFIDGTANPEDEAARDAAQIPRGAAGAGGPFVLTQQWVHDLAGFNDLAFACDIERFDVQPRRMYGVSGDGLHDRLTEFSRAVTGSYWFAPAKEDLDAALAMA